MSCPEITSDVQYSSCQELHEPITVIHERPRSRSSPSSPNPRHHLTHKLTDSPLSSIQSSFSTASMNRTKFRSISVGGIASGLASVVDRQPHHSWHTDNDDYIDPIEEITSPDSGSVLSDDEVLYCTSHINITIVVVIQYPTTTRELIHIRYILATADLVNLQLYNNKLYKEIIRGKVLFVCLVLHLVVCEYWLACHTTLAVYQFTGLDNWTDIFLVFTHVVIGLTDPH